MRRRAGEVGAKLDVISFPGRGTTVQLRFDKK
jgi:signal transduction histidine kinase